MTMHYLEFYVCAVAVVLIQKTNLLSKNRKRNRASRTNYISRLGVNVSRAESKIKVIKKLNNLSSSIAQFFAVLLGDLLANMNAVVKVLQVIGA